MDSASQYIENAATTTATNELDTDAILRGLNPAQLDAVTSPADVVQILAPPGSGKTRTLTARVAYLLANNHYNPANVIVATFTVKASKEMKERIGKLVGDGLERKLILGTFHSIARRYLVRYGHLIGIKKGFGIADSGDSSGIIKRIIKRNQFNVDASSTRSRISNVKAQGMNLESYLAQNAKTMKKDVGMQEFVSVFGEYEEALRQANLLDYDDLLLRCVDLLKGHPECARNVEAVLVDEFQDTNLVQFDLMRGFAKWRKRVTVVGDPDQSIYGFRAAEIKNLKRMKTVYPETLVVILEDNYRSSASILQSAQVVIEQDDSRPEKMLLPTHSVGTKPVLRHLRDAAQEAQWIVCEIKRIMGMTGNAIIPSDIAILVRSASLTRNIEAALAQHGVSYKMVGGLKFYDRVEVKAVLDYLRVCQNPQNNDALARVVNIPPRKVGDTTIKSLLDESHRKKKSLWDLIRGCVRGEIKLSTNITKTAEQGLAAFVNVILTSRKMLFVGESQDVGGVSVDIAEEDGDAESPSKTLVDIVYYLMKKLAYKDYLEKYYPEDHASRWANIEELVMQAADFTNSLATNPTEDDEALPEIDGIEQQKPSAMADALDRFLANVALASEVKQEDDEAPREQVTISTIHAAKGLEWPVVFIPGCYEGSIPHSRSEDTDEERRLLYVAMTRAMGLLYLSCPKKNSKYEKSALSQFLKDPNVLKLLDKKGPSLTPAVAQGVLQILGKECPDIETIRREMQRLESVEDDLFPLGDTVDEDEEDEEGGGRRKRMRYETDDYERGMQKASNLGRGGGYGYSKPKGWVGSAQEETAGGGGFVSARNVSYSTSTTSMTSTNKFSVNTTSMSGFTSAKGYMNTMNQRSTATETTTIKQYSYSSTRAGVSRSTLQETETHDKPSQSKKLERPKVGKETISVTAGKKKGTASTGQGSLLGLGFFKKPNPPTSGAGKQAVGGTVKALKHDEYVFLSSSPTRPPPVTRKPPPIARKRSPSPTPTPAEYSDFTPSPHLPPVIDLTEISPPSEIEEDLGNALPPPLDLPPPPPPVPVTFIPDSDGPDDDVIDEDAEEAYQEIEALNYKSYEPVLPKPLLTRGGSGEFLAAAVGRKGVRLVDPPRRQLGQHVLPGERVAPVFQQAGGGSGMGGGSNGGVARVGSAGAGGQQKKTLGIRRSMNGWESRMGGQQKTSITSFTRPISEIGGEVGRGGGGGGGSGSSPSGVGVRKSKTKKGGFIGGLLG